MWHLPGQSWLPDCAPMAEALLSVSQGALCLLSCRVLVSAACNASWDAKAASRERYSQPLAQDLPLVPLTLFWRPPSTSLAASLAGSSPAFSFQVFGQGRLRLCLKAGHDTICPAVLLPRDILQVSPGCPFGFKCSKSDDGAVGKDRCDGCGVG